MIKYVTNQCSTVVFVVILFCYEVVVVFVYGVLYVIKAVVDNIYIQEVIDYPSS
jgi:hypothetical protein